MFKGPSDCKNSSILFVRPIPKRMESGVILQTIKKYMLFLHVFLIFQMQLELVLLSDKHTWNRLREVRDTHARMKLGGHVTRAQRVNCDGEG